MMTMTEINLSEANARGTNYGRIWDELASPVLRVLDEEGNNVADCRLRHLLGKYWLCVDDVDGYQVLEQSAVERLILVAE